MKLRDEFETIVGDGVLLLRIFEELGFHVWFRYEKYREEFCHEDVIVAVDETPVGVFVEIEGSEQGITAMATALGRRPDDYVLDSYRGLFLKHRDALGLTGTDMVFDRAHDVAIAGALVLAAGLGTRLHPLTLARAKAAAPVDGEPLARRTIRWLVGARRPRSRRQPPSQAGDRSPPPSATAAISARASATRGSRRCSGSAGGPRHALPLLLDQSADAARDAAVLVNGDTLTNVDLPAMIEQHRRSGALVTMALIPESAARQVRRRPARRRRRGDRVHAPRQSRSRRFHFIGPQVVEADAFLPLEDGVPAESVLGALSAVDGRARRGSVMGFVSDAAFQDIGTPADLLQTSLDLAAADGRADRPRWGRNVRVAAIGARHAVGALGRRHASAPTRRSTECVVADGVDDSRRRRLRRCAIVQAPTGSWSTRRQLDRSVFARHSMPRDDATRATAGVAKLQDGTGDSDGRRRARAHPGIPRSQRARGTATRASSR